MEKVITPDMRKWISPLVHIGKEMEVLISLRNRSVLRPPDSPEEEEGLAAATDGQVPSTSKATHVPKGIDRNGNFAKLMEDLGKTDDGCVSEDEEDDDDDLADERRKSGAVQNDSDSEDETRDAPPISFLDREEDKEDDSGDSDEEVQSAAPKPLEQWLAMGGEFF
jgi:hypothetical protein